MIDLEQITLPAFFYKMIYNHYNDWVEVKIDGSGYRANFSKEADLVILPREKMVHVFFLYGTAKEFYGFKDYCR